MGTTFATTQDDVAAVLAKTKYKNIMTFLGAVSIHPDYCANGIVYESVCPIEIRYYDDYVLGRNWLSDTVALCREYMMQKIIGIVMMIMYMILFLIIFLRVVIIPHGLSKTLFIMLIRCTILGMIMRIFI